MLQRVRAKRQSWIAQGSTGSDAGIFGIAAGPTAIVLNTLQFSCASAVYPHGVSISAISAGAPDQFAAHTSATARRDAILDQQNTDGSHRRRPQANASRGAQSIVNPQSIAV